MGRVERKNSWQLAEAAGDATPHGLRRLPGRARRDAVRRPRRPPRLRRRAARRTDGVLIVDETGFKKGTHSAGVARQYSGTAGRVESCQVGVFLAYRTGRGAAFLDRALYLPKAWAEDRTRAACRRVSPTRSPATKPEPRQGHAPPRPQRPRPAAVGDRRRGPRKGHKFRRLIEESGLNYVVAVTSAQRLFLGGYYAGCSTLSPPTCPS